MTSQFMRRVQVTVLVPLRDLDGEMNRDDIFRNSVHGSTLIAKAQQSDYVQTFRTNDQGEFVIDTLLSGVRLCIFAEENEEQALFQVSPLRPGEDRDLGTISLKERKL